MIKKKFLLIIIPLTVVLTLAAYIGIGYAINGLQASKVSVKANLFNGSGFEWCMIYGYGNEYLCDMFYGRLANDKVIMKWNDEWARGEAENWSNPPYDDAWVIEEWNGNLKGGSGYTDSWKYKWDEGCATTHTTDIDGAYCWGNSPFLIIMHKMKTPDFPYIYWDWTKVDGKWYKHAAPAGLGN